MFFFWLLGMVFILISKNLIFLLIRIEIIGLSLAYYILISKNNYFKFFRFFKYYYIQSFFVYLIIIFIFVFRINKIRINLLLLLILCKINLFPRHIWINEVLFNLEIKEFFLLRVVAKIPVIFFLLNFYKLNYIIILSIFLTILWTIMIMKKFNYNNLLFSFSNLNSSCWIIIISLRSPYLILIFFFFYILIMGSVIYKNIFFIYNNEKIVPIGMINIARFPLRTIFFIKFVLFNFSRIRSIFIFILLIINSYLNYIYFKFILNIIRNIKYIFFRQSFQFLLLYYSFVFFYIFVL